MLAFLSKYRFAIIAVVLTGTASLIAHLYVQSQVYYPVVHMTLPEGLSIAAVLAETKERKACGARNHRFIAPFKQQCKECKIISARCERDLEGLDLALRQGEPVPYPIVVAREARVAFMGPADLAKIGCDATAATMVSKGYKLATCMPAHKDTQPKSQPLS
jgi:hypothetical protein